MNLIRIYKSLKFYCSFHIKISIRGLSAVQPSLWASSRVGLTDRNNWDFDWWCHQLSIIVDDCVLTFEFQGFNPK